MRRFCAWLLRVSGWTLIDSVPNEKKCVICVVPHTSNWDFVIGKLYYTALGRTASFLMKKEWFVFPLGYFFRSIGGIPVYRDKRMSLTDQMVAHFEANDTFRIAITPEGTRKPNADWKKGFYYIALKAGVPIQLAYIDYKKKEVGIAATFHPTGNEDMDMAAIKHFYKDVCAKKPENFIY